MENEILPAQSTSSAMAVQYGTGLNLAQVKWVAEVMHKSGLFSDTNELPQAIVKIMAGQELGLAPFAAMNGINIIKGRPTMAGNLIASKVKAHPKYDYRVVESDDLQCVLDWYEVIDGKLTKVGSNAYTLKMAQRAGLVKPDSNWNKYPEAMCFNRAVSAGQKLYAPDVFFMTVYTPEELNEGDEPGGYMPTKTRKQAEVVQTPPKAPKDAPEAETPATAAENAPKSYDETAKPSNDADSEIIDDETERTLAKRVKPVDEEFKAGIRTALDALGLKPAERMRLLKDSTGAISDKNLSERQWRDFGAAIDDMAIEIADRETEAETPQIQTTILEGENVDDNQTANDTADNAGDTAQDS